MKKLIPLGMALLLLAGCGGSVKSVDKELPTDLDFFDPNPTGGGIRLTVVNNETMLIPMSGTTKSFAPDASKLFATEQGRLFARSGAVFASTFSPEALAKRGINPGGYVILHFLVPYAPSVAEDLKVLSEVRDQLGNDKVTILGVYFVDMEKEKKEPAAITEEAVAFGEKHPEVKIYQADLAVVKKLGGFEDFPHTLVINSKARIIGDYAGPLKKDKLVSLLGK